MTSRPYDNSQLKNTDLLKYVLNKELESHRHAVEEMNSKKDPEFLWQFFSGLTAVLIWYISDAKNGKDIFWVGKILLGYFAVYFLLYKIVIRATLRILKRLGVWLRVKFVGIKATSLHEESKAEHHVQFFQQITLNKIALANSLLFDAKGTSDPFLSRYYAVECLEYLSSACSELVQSFSESNLEFIKRHQIVRARLKSYTLASGLAICDRVANELSTFSPTVQDAAFDKDLVNVQTDILSARQNFVKEGFLP